MSVHGKPILDRIDWLHDVARRYSAAYCDPEACLARELHRARCSLSSGTGNQRLWRRCSI